MYLFSDPLIKSESRTQILRKALKGLTKRNRAAYYSAVSFEAQMDARLQNYGQSCEPSNEEGATLNELFLEYNKHDYFAQSSWFADLDHTDSTRQDIQRNILEYPSGTICNHFQLLTCTPARTCDCKNHFTRDPTTNTCIVQNGYGCRTGAMKLFGFTKQTFYGKTSRSGFVVEDEEDEDEDSKDEDFYHHSFPENRKPGISYELHAPAYKFVEPQCEKDSICQHIKNFDTEFCLKADELAQVIQLQGKFDQKLSIGINEDCSTTDHENLFKIMHRDSHTIFIDRKTAFESVVNNPVNYCRIRHHSTCSVSGKCLCVPPYIPSETNECVAKLHEECGQAKTDLHIQLDTLILPLPIPGTQFAGDNVFCPTQDMKCEENPVLQKRLCTCAAGKLGEKCESDSSPHVALVDLKYLPPSLQTDEGLRLIADLHIAVGTFDKGMRLEYGQSCDVQPHLDLEPVLESLGKIKSECSCPPGGAHWICDQRKYECSTGPQPKFDKAFYEKLLEGSKELAAKSPALCKRIHGVTCVSGTCACPTADYVYLNGRCYLELAEQCYYNGPELPFVDSCRPGLYCDGSDYSPPRKCAVWYDEVEVLDPNDKSTGEEYLTKIVKALLNTLNIPQKNIEKIQRLKEGQTCNHAEEKDLKLIQMELEPVLDASKFSKDKTGLRQHIRLLQNVVSQLDKMDLKQSSSFCSLNNYCCQLNDLCIAKSGTTAVTKFRCTTPGAKKNKTSKSKRSNSSKTKAGTLLLFPLAILQYVY